MCTVMLAFVWLIFYKFYTREIIEFTTVTLADKLYNHLYAQKGKALSKQDFKKIEKEKLSLYACITSCLCHGYCYSVCFDILKILKAGNIKFVAIKEIPIEGKAEKYTMHVFYEKNGWVFNTYNQCQYPVEKALILHKGIVYKDFSYDDIKGLTYDEFRDKNCEELAKWCKDHECWQNWNKKDE